MINLKHKTNRKDLLKMTKKTIKLINDENTNVKIKSAKACISTERDICVEIDVAICYNAVMDLCVKDYAACIDGAEDVCSERDHASCYGEGSEDYCDIDFAA